MNKQKLEELIGESVWNTYRDMAYLLREIALPKEKQHGKIPHDDPTAEDRPEKMERAVKLRKKGQKKAKGGS